jgi:PAS domain S-box-containing protein
MTTELRILILENISEDAELINRILKKENFSFSSKIVGRKKDFLRELRVFQPDLILSDYSMPQFTGLEALEIVRQITPETPFIIITGSLNEEKAVDCIKAGAWDYLIKDNLFHLGSAVKSAMILKDERDKKLRALQTLRESEKIYRSFVENASDIIFITDIQGNYRFGNAAGLKTSGYTIEELQKLSYLDLMVPEYKNRIRLHYMRQYRTREPESFIEYPFRSKDGKILWFAQKSSLIYEDDAITGFHHLARDVTERKQAEITLQNSETRYRTLFESSSDAVMLFEKNGFIDCNSATLRIFGLKDKKEFIALHPSYLSPDIQPCGTDSLILSNEMIASAMKEGSLLFEWVHKRLDTGRDFPAEVMLTRMNIEGRPVLQATVHDISKRKQAEEEREKLLRLQQGVNLLQHSLLEPATLDDKLKKITDNIVRVFDADFCRIWIIRPGDLCEQGCQHAGTQEKLHLCLYRDKCLHLISSSGRYTHTDGEGHRRVPFGCYKIGHIASDEDPEFITNDVVNDPLVHDHAWARKLGLVSFAGYQLHVPGGKTLGVIALFARHPILPAEDAMFEGLGNAVAMVIQQAVVEEERRASEEKLRSIFNASPSAISVIDLNGSILDCNPATLKIHGLTSKEEVTGKSAFDLVAPGERQRAMEVFKETIEKGFNERFEFLFLKKDGLVVPVEASAGVIHDSLGNLQSIVVISQDITERKRAEEVRIRLETVIEQTSEIVIITDVAGAIQYVNPAFEKITGYRSEEVIGNNPRLLKSGKHDEAFYGNLWRTITNGAKWKGRFINRKKDGQLYSEEASITPIKDSSGVITNFAAVKRDVTNELIIEQRIRETQKMEAIGTLAGGIAHDFNNILAAIIGYAELSLDTVPEDSQVHSDLKQIFKAGNRARSLISQILTFSRQREQGESPISLAPIVKETLKLLRASLPSTIEVRQTIESETGTILADPTQIHQVIMNLCTNAGHAMNEKGGILEVSLSRKEIDYEFCLAHPGLIPGQYLELMVSDTGYGMAPDILPRIFEPYFTTKEKSGGTGLGLSMVHGIVAGCGGIVTVYSDPGKGSTFKVYLPAVNKKPALEAEKRLSCAKGRERILFVDDEQDIVNVGKRILENLGFTVTIVTSSLDALELFKKTPNQFDLIITDMTMPRMTGDELSSELIHIRPDIPIIVCTGYSEKLTEEKAMSIGIRAYMGKPLLKSEMAETIRRVLDCQNEVA